ncbi:MAG: hypothetical protein MJZ68_06045 [archaeon]|nr:hypothetical protein [archaeon]
MKYETVRIFEAVMVVGIILAVLGVINVIGYIHIGLNEYVVYLADLMILVSAVVFGIYLHERRRIFEDVIERMRIAERLKDVPDDGYLLDLTAPPRDRSYSLGPALPEEKKEPLPEIIDLNRGERNEQVSFRQDAVLSF